MKFSTQQSSENRVMSNKRLAELIAIFTFAVAIFNVPIRQRISRGINCLGARRGEPTFSNDPSNWVSPSLIAEMSNKKFNTVWNNPGFHLISLLVLKITESNKISDGAYCKSCRLILLMRKRKSDRPLPQLPNTQNFGFFLHCWNMHLLPWINRSPNNTHRGYFPAHKHAFSVHKSITGFGKKYKRVAKANKVISSATHMASKFNSNYVIFIYDSLDVVFMWIIWHI